MGMTWKEESARGTVVDYMGNKADGEESENHKP